MADVFEKRIRRAEQLLEQWPFAAELLRFYGGLAAVQRSIFARPPEAFPGGAGFTAAFKADLGALLDCVAAQGPPLLADQARSWKADVAEHFFTEQSRPHQPTGLCTDCPSPLYHFVQNVYDCALRLRTRLESKKDLPPRVPSGDCPFCERLPLVAVLREDKSAETVRRSLICSQCSMEWDFPRVMCPDCREERPEKLPRLTAQEIPWMRVEACDSCRKFIKSVDLTKDWEAEPLVDELASTPLDIIAREHGYTKIAPNLTGI
jgi:formate dehydrogenase maturation protein FdhE